LDLLSGELQRRGNDERVTRGDANPVAVLVRLPSNLLEGSLQRRDRQRAVGRASRQVAVLGREVDARQQHLGGLVVLGLRRTATELRERARDQAEVTTVNKQLPRELNRDTALGVRSPFGGDRG